MLISVWSMCQFWISLHRKVKFFLSEFWSFSGTLIKKWHFENAKLKMLWWFWNIYKQLIKWGASRPILSIVHLCFKITMTFSIFGFSKCHFLIKVSKNDQNSLKKTSLFDEGIFKIDTCSKLKSEWIWAFKCATGQDFWHTF